MNRMTICIANSCILFFQPIWSTAGADVLSVGDKLGIVCGVGEEDVPLVEQQHRGVETATLAIVLEGGPSSAAQGTSLHIGVVSYRKC